MACDIGHKEKNKQFRFPYLYPSGFLMIDITLISGANLHENIVQVLVIFKMTASYFILTSFFYVFLTFLIFIDNILIFCENKKICCALSTRGMLQYPQIRLIYSHFIRQISRHHSSPINVNQHLLCIWLWMQGVSCFRFSAQESKFINHCAWFFFAYFGVMRLRKVCKVWKSNIN